ncbi:MAG: LPS assembly protein LptD [Legionellales bacterium]|nr:LPS assembly protein LptD [Legionellales bacterium]
MLWIALLQPAFAAAEQSEWIRACVWDIKSGETPSKDLIASCLGWQASQQPSFCRGAYSPLPLQPLPDPNAIELKADQVSFRPTGTSDLRGHVQVQQDSRMVTARTASVYRNAQTHQIERIDLDSDVHFMDPGRLMIAQHGHFYPKDKSGYVQKAVYRFDTNRYAAVLPAWGTAEWIRRFANQNYHMHAVTYTTCSPSEDGWQIQAKDIRLDHASQTGVARQALLRLGKVPILYTPYMSFPTSRARKSGFLMPMGGYTNVSGFDFVWPYYLNLAPNYDATLVPHYYALRGWMMGGTTRFLTSQSTGIVGGSILPHDPAMKEFITQNVEQYPQLQGTTVDRWSVLVRESTRLLPNLNFDIDFQQVSDDYYLQDFSTNLAMSSENQLLRRGSLVYTSDHWLIGGAAQSYQTLHPVNQSGVADIYDRLPQVLADGAYHDLPLHTDLHVLAQFDYFRWSGLDQSIPQGSRYHLNPILSLPRLAPWGYVTPSIEMVENNYGLSYNTNPYGQGHPQSEAFNRLLPRGYVDSGLVFERDNAHLFGRAMRQTLEPRLFYLNVPYVDQSQFPSFDSAYMIFNTDQLFRTNRFSGFDRISDANQLAYAATTRWLSPTTGQEKAQLTLGQIHYFSQRKVQLCYRQNEPCIDNPLFLGYVSPTAQWSPVAMKGVYNLNAVWSASTDYVWDPATSATNNANVNLHYHLSPERILGFGYNYLVSGNVIAVTEAPLNNRPLNQVTGSYAWPFNEHWSSLGVYSYNLSEGYNMLAFFGLQYDSCCWAARLIGGQTFKSLSPDAVTPQYNNNVYFQIILKGLGSVANSNPSTMIQSYLPGYRDAFHR